MHLHFDVSKEVHLLMTKIFQKKIRCRDKISNTYMFFLFIQVRLQLVNV